MMMLRDRRGDRSCGSKGVDRLSVRVGGDERGRGSNGRGRRHVKRGRRGGGGGRGHGLVVDVRVVLIEMLSVLSVGVSSVEGIDVLVVGVRSVDGRGCGGKVCGDVGG